MSLQPRQDRAPPSVLHWCAVVGAFGICLAVLIFSWPDPLDRKRALGPKLARCCNIVKLVTASETPGRVVADAASPASTNQMQPNLTGSIGRR